MENGRYHVVRDWVRSIFPVTSEPHSRLPLDESRPLWERIALMNYWIGGSYPKSIYADPARTLSLWRIIKLKRGFARHPSSSIRLEACRALIDFGYGQDECWDTLTVGEKVQLKAKGHSCCTEEQVEANRRKLQQREAAWWWRHSSDREFGGR